MFDRIITVVITVVITGILTLLGTALTGGFLISALGGATKEDLDRLTAAGVQGLRGERGDEGPPGPKGDRGEPGQSGASLDQVIAELQENHWEELRSSLSDFGQPVSDVELLSKKIDFMRHEGPRWFLWRKGDPPLPMIERSDGFCYLSHVGFRVGNDYNSVDVSYHDQQSWFLRDGGSPEADFQAAAVCYHYPGAIDE